MSCTKTSNNKYFNCPPRMDDARHFTNYAPNCDVENRVFLNNDIFNSHQKRMHLVHNATKYMDLNRKQACDKNCCGPCQEPYETGTMLPEQSVMSCDGKTCNVKRSVPTGLGLGRNYNNQQLHCQDWPDSLPVNTQMNNCAPASANFNYLPDSKAQGEDLGRLTVPAGAVAYNGGDPAFAR